MREADCDAPAKVAVVDLRAYEALLVERLLTLPMIAYIPSNLSLRQVRGAAL